MSKNPDYVKQVVQPRVTEQQALRALDEIVDEHGRPTPAAQRATLKALTVQRGLVLKNLRRLRRKYPQDLALRLARQYVRAVSGAGAAAGAVSLVPGAGTIAGFGVSAGAAIGFLELSALYAQSIAELHGMPTHADKNGQAYVMAVLLGREGQNIIRDTADIARGKGSLAATVLVMNSGSGLFDALFSNLRDRFLKRVMSDQAAGVFGRIMPFGVGAIIGGIGNRNMGRAVVRSTYELFGPVPYVFPKDLDLFDDADQPQTLYAPAPEHLNSAGSGNSVSTELDRVDPR